MTPRTDRGMSSAEYAVGTLGACTMALVLHQVVDEAFIERLLEIFREALAWRNLRDGFPIPFFGS